MSDYTVEAFFEYIEKARSKNTLRMYQQSLAKFSEWYGKPLNEILAERRADWKSDDLFTKKRFAQEVEKFHKHLIERGYTPSTAATLAQGIKTLFTYFEMPLPASRETSKQVATTRDYVPRISEYQAMFKACDSLRDRLILSMGLSLGWRIGDFVSIKKAELPDLEQEAPIAFEKITEKEDTIAKSFLSAETVALLREYLATTKNDKNPFLFTSNGVGHLVESSINRMLQTLAEKAALPIPSQKRLRFHCFRKRLLSECANLKIDVNIAKLLVGKNVERSMLAYLSGVDLRGAFLKVSEQLRLTKVQALPKQADSEVMKRVEALERRQELYEKLIPDVVQKVDEMLKSLGLDKMSFKSFGEKMDAIATAEDAKRRAEYEKLIAENNHNNSGED